MWFLSLPLQYFVLFYNFFCTFTNIIFIKIFLLINKRLRNWWYKTFKQEKNFMHFCIVFWKLNTQGIMEFCKMGGIFTWKKPQFNKEDVLEKCIPWFLQVRNQSVRGRAIGLNCNHVCWWMYVNEALWYLVDGNKPINVK